MDKETVVRLLNLLSDSDRNTVLRDAAQNGFIVDGFKDLTKVPQPILTKAIGGRKRRKISKYPYQLILESIARLQPDENPDLYAEDSDNLTPSIVAQLCLKNNFMSMDKVNAYLEKSEKSIHSTEDTYDEICTTNDEYDEISKYIDKLKSAEERIHDLDEVNATLRQKNSKLQKKVQEYKIENDNLKNSNKRIQKEYEKIITEYEECIQQNKDLKREKDTIKQEVVYLEKEIKLMIEKVNVLEDMALKEKSKRKKICCLFSGKLGDDLLSQYDIDVHKVYSEKQIIEWNLYQGVWLCTKDVPFGVIRAIKKLAVNCEIVKFSNINDLKEKIMVGEQV